MFRPSDVRRVQAAFQAALPAPYEATITLSPDRLELIVTVADPDEPQLVVSSGIWTHDPRALKGSKQPDDAEIAEIAAMNIAICTEYPAKKAADAAEKAARDARIAANLEARQADAEDRAKAERRLKSSAAKVLGADELTPEMVDAIQNAANDPALD